MDKSIGVFDSGIGGFTILEELKKILPHENFIYYKDTKHNPYGEKSEEEIYIIVKNIVEYLISLNVKMIVIACNTATTRCMKRLRVEYPNMIFVGTVPAVKVACDKDYKNILVMATPSTIDSARIHELIYSNQKKNQKIELLACDGLANLIENNSQVEIDRNLEKIFKNYINKEIDSVVLGCTHYPLIKNKIQSFFPNAKLLDSSYGVAKEVKHQLEKHQLLNKSVKQEVKIIDNV